MASELLNPDALISWLREQPPEGEYTWSDPVFCLMGKYVTDRGTPADLYGYGEMPNYHQIAETKPHTFGAALLRAEKLRALPVIPPEVPLVHDHEQLRARQTDMPAVLALPAPRPQASP